MDCEHLQSCSAGDCLLIDGGTLGKCVDICQPLRAVGSKNLSLILCKLLEKAAATLFRAACSLGLNKVEWRARLLVKQQREKEETSLFLHYTEPT